MGWGLRFKKIFDGKEHIKTIKLEATDEKSARLEAIRIWKKTPRGTFNPCGNDNKRYPREPSLWHKEKCIMEKLA